MPLSPTTRLGRYEIRALLGAGGMGEVYRAWDHDLEREVAIKVLREGGGERRFIQEAKAASGLHHPNIAHVYEIGTHEELRFISMELVQGETLRARLSRGAMPVDDAIEIAMQIAGALGAAHKAGVVHRDLKPENVVITPDGYAKVLDFGLAKLREIRGDDAATLLKTAPGVAMGTIGYMAPEQLVGADVTPAADVFSLGVVLYEMVAGHRPFEGATTTDVVQAILTKPPQSLRDMPPKLTMVIAKALAKNADERYRAAGEVLDELRAITRERTVVATAKRSNRGIAVALGVAIVIAIAAAAAWMYVRHQRRTDAIAKIAVAETLVKQRKLAEAYEAAMKAAAVLPGDPRVRELVTRTSTRLTVQSDPPGATVSLQRFNGPEQRVLAGVTPLTTPEIARGDYLVTIEKSGYASAVRPVTLMPRYLRDDAFYVDVPPLRVRLVEASKVPAGMVWVEGGPYRLQGYLRLSDRLVELRDFAIDRTEVTNREFERFVRDGGYRRPELWKHPFVDGGKVLTFEQAMERLRDTTGLPGPRGWSGGLPPAELADHPVTGVTWYEAAAFAQWKGKALPTVFQWEKAARPIGVSTITTVFPWGAAPEGTDANERANFRGKGTMPADSMPFGASPYGALHMAGNVTEWCRNAHRPGYTARGGAWNDAMYAFGQTAGYPGFFSSPTLGFRCAIGGGGDEGDFELSPAGFVPVYKPVDDRTFDTYARRFEYKREPLDARVVERVETADWTREKITFQVAGKTVPAYLYLPKGFRRPLQVIHFAPAGDVVNGLRTLSHSMEVNLGPLIRSGRAVFAVELEGFLGRPRPPGFEFPSEEQDEYVDHVVRLVTEMRRGLDYLETRPDIDRTRIAFLGVSAGGGPGVFVTALESRYRAVVFRGTGIATREKGFAAAANRINFVPHIRAPKMLLQGKYDEDTSLTSEVEPMYRLLPEPKRLELYEGGHIAPPELFVPAVTKFLDQNMGPV